MAENATRLVLGLPILKYATKRSCDQCPPLPDASHVEPHGVDSKRDRAICSIVDLTKIVCASAYKPLPVHGSWAQCFKHVFCPWRGQQVQKHSRCKSMSFAFGVHGKSKQTRQMQKQGVDAPRALCKLAQNLELLATHLCKSSLLNPSVAK